MTEPTFSLTGDPASVAPVKAVKKRATSGSAPRSAGKTTPKTATPAPVEGMGAEAEIASPKKRARSLKPVAPEQPVLEQSNEVTAKKRTSRAGASKRNASSDIPALLVQEVQPEPAPSPVVSSRAPVRGRRKKELTGTSAPEAMEEATVHQPTRQADHPSATHPVEALANRNDPEARGRRGRQPRVQTVADVADQTPPPIVPRTANRAPVSAASDDAADQAERVRKPYPVYVPLHIAKQMEQEGRPAPLAVAPDAQQAESIRAAALENRHAPHPHPTGAHSDLQSDTIEQAERHEGHRQERPPQHQRQDRNQDRGQQQPAHQRQDRNQRNPQRSHGPERSRDGRHNDGRNNDRHRNREDQRRNDRRDHAQEAGYQNSHREHTQDLPPPSPEELTPGGGVIEISGKGFGFLRDPLRNFVQHPADIFVSPEMVRRFNLRDGQMIRGSVRKSGRGQQIHEITSVNDDPPEASKHQPAFDELTVINPCEPLHMATVPERYTTRIIDMLTPIGKGQRGLIVAQPRTGKTTFLQHIADAMVKNHPDVKLIILLVDERPEEVTEIRHTVPSAEIMASSNDMDVRSHTRIAELAIERAKRLVEAGKDVFILLDSITRLGRAFNNALSNGGRTMSGGLDARALETPRKLFAAARNTEEAGSLTIIATALIDTGSRMDEIIFQEFKGTGNMELVLDRKIAESRIYPAVDIFQSGTRREELLVPADLLQKIHFLRRGLSGARPMDAIDRLLSYLKKFPTNEQMLREIRG
jgi:transcription termination factor Rho